jgi:3-deoxy-7-phosphoheptulonate synthase
MHAEKWKFRIGHGVDEIAHKVLALRPNLVVFAAEGHNPDGSIRAGERGEAVRLQAGAGDDARTLVIARGAVDAPGIAFAIDRRDARGSDHFPALGANQALQGFADTRIVNDSFLRNTNGGDSGGVRLNLPQLVAGEHFQAFQAILRAALKKSVETREFLRAGGGHDLSADFVRNGMLAAEVDHLTNAGDGEPRFSRAGFVIKAGVEDTAVVAALMAANGGFFFKNGDAGIGETLAETPGGGESDDASADDHDTLGHFANSHLVIIKDMLIVMKALATEADIERVRVQIENLGFRAHIMPGEQVTAIGITGNQKPVDPVIFEGMSGVAEAIRVSKPYKLVSREVRHENSIIRVHGIPVGGDRPMFCGGPCSVEGREQILEAAHAVKKAGGQLLRGGAYKPRTSPYSFQGLGEEGLQLLAEARDATGLGIVTEAIDVETFDLVEKYTDCIQIGARNMQNYSLLKRAGKARKPVLLKRGMSATLEEFLMAAEYILSEGNYEVILCERGVRTFADHTRNTLDLSIVPAVQKLSHLPIVVDPSHGTGKRDSVYAMALAGIAAGASGLLVEVHPQPDRSWSDGAQTVYPHQFAEMVADSMAIAELLLSRRSRAGVTG